MYCTLGVNERKYHQGLAGDVFWNSFHQGNSLLSPTEGNKGIYQRHIGLLHQCSLGLHLGYGAALCDRIVADGTCNSLCYWLYGALSHACQLLLPGTPLNVLTVNSCCPQVLSGAEDSFVLPWDTLFSCSARAPRQHHCWLLPVIAYMWQRQRLPRLGSPNHVWWGFVGLGGFFFSSFFGLCSHSIHKQ